MAVMRNLRRSTVQNEIPARRGDCAGLPNGRGLCRRDAGFSLVELIITIVLLGIVAAIAVPSYPGLGRQHEPERRREGGLFRCLRHARQGTGGEQGLYHHLQRRPREYLHDYGAGGQRSDCRERNEESQRIRWRPDDKRKRGRHHDPEPGHRHPDCKRYYDQ